MNKLCKRSLAAVLAVTMLTGMPIPALTFQQPMIANAVETQMNAAKALGLSDEAPDGFDEDDPLKNPYGRKTVTFGDANEVLVGHPSIYVNQDGFYLFGDNTIEPLAQDGILDDSEGQLIQGSQEQYGFVDSKLSKTAAGNFDGNTEGKTNQFVMIRTPDSYAANELKLSVHNARTGETDGRIEFGIDASARKWTGLDISRYLTGQMSIATGDFDGNGRDEIAVLSYSESGWQDYWFYSSDNEDFIANMTLEGFTEDVLPAIPDDEETIIVRTYNDNGTINQILFITQWLDNRPPYIASEYTSYDSYAFTYAREMYSIMYFYNEESPEEEIGCWGVRYYREGTNIGSTVNVYAFTNTDGNLYDINDWELKRTFPVNSGEAISLAAGDVNRDGIDDLIIGENNTIVPETGKPASVTVYSGAYTGMLLNKTVIESETDSKLNKYGVTVFSDNSSGTPVTYLGVLASNATEGKITVYKYNGEKIAEVGSVPVTLSGDWTMQQNELFYMNGYICSPLTANCVKLSNGSPELSNYGNYDVSGMLQDDDDIVFDCQTADLNGTGQQTVLFKAFWTGASESLVCAHSFGATNDIRGGFSYHTGNFFAIVNIDDDTSSMTYTGRHWFEYTEPKVLAVLASPPYFKDLLENDDLSGNYPESTTAYGSSHSDSSGTSKANGFSVGAYASYEMEGNFLGFAKLAFEASLSETASFTWETEKSLETAYSVEYATSSGADAVVFYSVPYEFYEYEVTYYDKENNEIQKATRTLKLPKKACTATIELEKYQSIAANYSELPDLSNVMHHELGNPASYPSSTSGYHNVREFNGDYLAVDFTSAGGGITQSQSIEMTEENAYSYTYDLETEFQVGVGFSVGKVGVGNVKVGVTGGYEHEEGTMTATTEGSSFSVSMQNMPKEAEEYGYGMSWKLFSHEGSYINSKGKTVLFPVVDYLVTDVTQPPARVSDFRQDYRSSSERSVMLEWDYDSEGGAEFFNVFRISNINGREAKILAATVPASGGSLNDDGSFTFTMEDDGRNVNGTRLVMKPGVQYEYQIVAARDPSKPPCVAMPSDVLYAYTHSEGVYPDITVTGARNNKLTMYPEQEYSIGAEISNEDDFMYITYQWQKKGKTGWVDIRDEVSDTLEFGEPNADLAGKYRCRIDALTFNEEMNSQVGVTVFTDDIDVTFKMRSVKQNAFDVSCKANKPEAVFTVLSASNDCLIAPTGTVVFTVKGASFENTYSVPLTEGRRTSTAKLSDAADLTDLADGIYQISANYSGDSIFGSFQSETKSVLVGDDAIFPVLFNQNGERTNTFYYGDSLTLKFYRYTKNADGKTNEEYVSGLNGITNQKLKDTPDSFNKTITVDGTEYSYSYTLKKRPVEIGISDVGTLFAGDVEGKLPQAVLLTELVAGDTLDELVTVAYMNGTATKDVSINNDTVPGSYYAKLTPSKADGNKTAYYDLKLNSSTFSIYSRLYDLSISSVPCNENEAGAVRMKLPESKTLVNGTLRYESGTSVKLTASPYSGYLFDHWTVNGTEYTTSTISFNMSSQAYDVKAYFKKDTSNVETGSIIVDDSFLMGGTVQYPADFDNSSTYPIGKEFTFTAVDTDGAVFDHWKKIVGRKSYKVYSREITASVSETPVILYPVFTGVPCTVTLGEGISAEYETINEEDEAVRNSLASGDTVQKGTEIILTAASEEGYAWYINGEMQNESQHTLKLTVIADVEVEYKPTNALNQTAPEISAQPQDTLGNIGETAKFTVSATAAAPAVNYQWQFLSNTGWKNSGMTGANTATLSVPITAERDGQQYRCVVTDSTGASVTSESAKISVKAAITSQPTTQELEVGQTAKFTVAAVGKNLKYQWQFLSNTGWKNSGMTGANTAVLSVPVTAERNGQQYKCIVTAENGTTATSNAASIKVKTAITTQPTNQNGKIDSTVKFTVAASGANLKYQWQFLSTSGWQNSGMTGANTATLSVPVTAARDGQQYKCIVTSSNGTSAESNIVKLIAGVKITAQPKDYTGNIGTDAKFTVAASGTNLTYQWQFYASSGWQNSGMDGAKTATISVPITAARNGQKYRCVVKSANGTSDTSAAATLKTVAAGITGQPQNAAGKIGDTVKFTVTASNATYQWQFLSTSGWQNSGMTGTKTATISVPVTEARDGQKYRCVVKFADGTTKTSNEVSLKVQAAVTAQPKDTSGKVGTTAQFTVAASGTNLTYQWQFLANTGWKDSGMTGAKTATISVPITDARNGQQYRCIVTSGNGTTATSNPAKLTVTK